MTTEVLPVLRSPMISSRWPRPIGVIASMALIPVCSGSCTGWRPMMPGAWTSMRRVCVGVDRALAVDGLAERVDHAAQQRVADGDRLDPAGRLDDLLLLELVDARRGRRRRSSPRRGSARGPSVPSSNSSSSLTAGAGQAGHARDAVADLDDAADLLGADLGGVLGDVPAQRLGDLARRRSSALPSTCSLLRQSRVWPYAGLSSQAPVCRCSRSASSRPRAVASTCRSPTSTSTPDSRSRVDGHLQLDRRAGQPRSATADS